MLNNPFFSIITVVKNNRKDIERCIKSVLNQSFRNFEHIIIDGYSTDGTLNIIHKYKKKTYLKLFKKKNGNLWSAMNYGLKKSNGDIVCFLNSDDYFTKNALSTVRGYFKSKKIDYFFGAVKKRKIFYHFNPEKIYYKFNCYPSHSVSFFIKKKIHLKIGLYDEKLFYGADLDFFYKLFRSKDYSYCNGKRNELLGYFCLRGLSSKVGYFKALNNQFKIRYKNNQNFIFLIILYIANIFNKVRNLFL